jgi:hypothetical protein
MPAFTQIRQIAQHERGFMLNQFTHHLPVHTVCTPFALANQNIVSFPIDRNRIHLYTAVPLTADLIWCKGKLTALAPNQPASSSNDYTTNPQIAARSIPSLKMAMMIETVPEIVKRKCREVTPSGSHKLLIMTAA